MMAMKRSISEVDDFIKYVNNTLGKARTITYFKQQIQTIISDLGFSHFDFSMISENNNFEFILTSIPASLVNTYEHERLYKHDFFLENLLSVTQPVYQSAIYRSMDVLLFSSESIEKNKIIRDLSYDHGFFDCFCIPVDLNQGKRKVVLTVLSEGQSVEDFKINVVQKRANLVYLAHSIYKISQKKFPRHFPYKPLLSEKEIMVIEAFAKYAKTAAHAADQLFISNGTVNNYVEKIKDSLGAVGLGNAICIAIDKGLINCDPKIQPK